MGPFSSKAGFRGRSKLFQRSFTVFPLLSFVCLVKKKLVGKPRLYGARRGEDQECGEGTLGKSTGSLSASGSLDIIEEQRPSESTDKETWGPHHRLINQSKAEVAFKGFSSEVISAAASPGNGSLKVLICF